MLFVMFISTCVRQEDDLERLLLVTCSHPTFRYLKAVLWCIVGNLRCGKKQWTTYFGRIKYLLNLIQRRVFTTLLCEIFHLLLHQDLDIAQLRVDVRE